MRVLLIDNYDSFTFNLVQALRTLGADVEVRRNDVLTPAEALADAPAAIVLSPGPCTPAEAGISVELVRAAAAAHVPLLGVCLGHQAIGVAFGGRVAPAARLVHGKTSRIHHDGRSVFAGLPNPFEATRYHSLVVDRPLPDDLVATAWSEAGPRCEPGRAPRELMGMRHRTLPVEAVQFHPESFLTPAGPALLENFLNGVRRPTPAGAP